MSHLERIDPTKPLRKGVTVFCDRCHQLKPCQRFVAYSGKIEWLCDGGTCAPKSHERMREVVAHSPPPPDAVPSPAIDQWFEPVEPPDLHSDFPAELADLEIDQMLLDADLARDSEPIGAEPRRGADDDA